MHVSFMLGWRQAVRLGQARAPISAVDLERQVISWPGSVVKGGRGYTHPIDPRLAPFLEELIRHRQAAGKDTLADVPRSVASLHWRKFLDSLSLRGLSHHGLRTSWVTNAARSGIHESAACKFANHSQVATHRIYLKWADSDLADQLRKLL
jgi:integrase